MVLFVVVWANNGGRVEVVAESPTECMRQHFESCGVGIVEFRDVATRFVVPNKYLFVP